MNLYKLQKLNHLVVYLFVIVCGYLVNVSTSKILTNSYLVEFHQATDRALADQIAARNGFTNAGPVKFFNFLIKQTKKRNRKQKKILFSFFFFLLNLIVL